MQRAQKRTIDYTLVYFRGKLNNLAKPFNSHPLKIMSSTPIFNTKGFNKTWAQSKAIYLICIFFINCLLIGIVSHYFTKTNDSELKVSYLVEGDTALRLSDLEHQEFIKHEYGSLPLSESNKTYWIKIKAEHHVNLSDLEFIVLSPSYIRDISFYKYNETVKSWTESTRHTFDENSVIRKFYKNNIYQVSKEDSTQIFYAKLSHPRAINLTIEVREKEKLQNDNYLAFTFLGGLLFGTLPLIIFFMFLYTKTGILKALFPIHAVLVASFYFLSIGFEGGIVSYTPEAKLAFVTILLTSSTLFMFAFMLKEIKSHHWLQKNAYRLAMVPMLLAIYLFASKDIKNSLNLTIGYGAIVILIFTSVLQYYFNKSKPSKWLITGLYTLLGLTSVSVWLEIIGVINLDDHAEDFIRIIIIETTILFSAILWYFEIDKKINTDRLETQQKFEEQIAYEATHRREVYESFMGMLIHEIKTPLSIIQIAAISLSRRFTAESNEFTRISKIEKAVTDINEILIKCVQASDIESDSVIVVNSLFEVDMIEQDIYKQFETDRIDFQFFSGNHLYSDYTLVKTIIVNLLSNAIKYSKDDSKIIFKCSDIQVGNKPRVKFSVVSLLGESGAPERDKLFKRNYRNSKAQSKPGTGLGLWMSQEIAKLLGTTIDFQNFGEQIIFSFDIRTK